MTMKPKARKFRLRRGATSESPEAAQEPQAQTGAAQGGVASASGSLFEPEDDGFGGMDFRKGDAPKQAPQGQGKTHPVRPNRPNRGQAPANPAQAGGQPTAKVVRKGRAADPQQKGDLTPEQEVDAVKSEGLTGRQLRIARRVAQRNGLNPTSDLDAVRLLRERGIDPFAKENMLQLVAQESKQPAPNGQQKPAGKTQLPQTVPAPGANVPGPVVPQGMSPEAEVAKEVRKIQRDIVRRRRKRGVLLMIRLMFFVFLPTFLAGTYYFKYATPLFATNSQFIIQQADAAPSPAGGLGGVLSGGGLGTSQDAVTVQSYLQSRDAMLRLDADLGFKEHFSSDAMDPLQRLDADATNEAAYRLYQKHVKIGFDPTEGLVKMEVIAADPATSQAFSEALIAYAEEQVDNLTQRLREDQMAGARESY